LLLEVFSLGIAGAICPRSACRTDCGFFTF
jgi:hypothetical protein